MTREVSQKNILLLYNTLVQKLAPWWISYRVIQSDHIVISITYFLYIYSRTGMLIFGPFIYIQKYILLLEVQLLHMCSPRWYNLPNEVTPYVWCLVRNKGMIHLAGIPEMSRIHNFDPRYNTVVDLICFVRFIIMFEYPISNRCINLAKYYMNFIIFTALTF